MTDTIKTWQDRMAQAGYAEAFLHPRSFMQEEIDELRAALAQQTGQAELNTLLHEIDKQCGNGMIPWPIEDAFAAYEKAVAAAPKGRV